MSSNMKFQYWGGGQDHGYWKQLGLLQLMYANSIVLHPNFKCVHWLSQLMYANSIVLHPNFKCVHWLSQLMYANSIVLHPNFKCVRWLSPM